MDSPLTQLRRDHRHSRSDDDRRPDHIEWLETDGLGGFACGSVTMCPARRYHGLLIAPLPGTARRHLFFAGFDETLITSAGEVALSSPRHAGEEPGKFAAPFESFELVPWPRTRFLADGFEIRREILMPKGRHAVMVRYVAEIHDPDTSTGDGVTLTLRPNLPFREADSLTFRNDALRSEVEVLPDGIRCRPYDALPSITIRADPYLEFAPDPSWDLGVEYDLDLARGYDGHEDLFSPGSLTLRLAPGESVVIEVAIEQTAADIAAEWANETDRRRRTMPRYKDPLGRCRVAADDFLYRDRSSSPEGRLGILAGFPWFGEWGRDTFIALPGLTLARGRILECAEVLSGALPFLDDGLLPNIFGKDKSDSHYGSVDASLWFARAVLLYDRADGDELKVLDDYLPALVAIADHYAAGVAPRIAALGIGADEEMMIHAGSADANPTWMDAKPASGAVTPRHGCPVEICALWYSLLCFVAELAGRRRDKALRRRFTRMAETAGGAFLSRFWLPEPGYLADVWRPDEVDHSIRPNMVIAAALEFSPLSRSQRERVLQKAEAELLTPYGLRTLSRDNPDYAPRYRGSVEERDRAYHQGTVWPWLLGFFCETAMRVDNGRRTGLRTLFKEFVPQLSRGGLNHISEVFGGDPPHESGGTFAQAWNTAEVLRAIALLEGSLSNGTEHGKSGRNRTGRQGSGTNGAGRKR